MQKDKYSVAVVGAMGMVGSEMIRTLERRAFPIAELRPLDLPANAGKTVLFRGQPVAVQTAGKENFKDIDLAIFSAGGDASRELAPQAVEMGAVVIDNSSQWRMDAGCPLVVPEVNPHDLKWHSGIIANPNCSTIQMVVVLKPLHDRSSVKKVIVSTYQAAAGGGQRGCDALRQEAEEYLKSRKPVEPRLYDVQLAFNVVPQIDVFQEKGYTKEEYKMIHETAKIMGDDGIKVTATCVRVPVFIGHAESIYVETADYIGANEAGRLLAAAPSIIVKDNPQRREYPTPFETETVDETLVGRIREDLHNPNALNLWVVSNNIRKGAALNAVQIAETLVKMNLIRVPGKDGK